MISFYSLLAEKKITATEYLLLYFIQDIDGVETTVTEICNTLGINPRTFRRCMVKLLSIGVVESVNREKNKCLLKVNRVSFENLGGHDGGQDGGHDPSNIKPILRNLGGHDGGHECKNTPDLFSNNKSLEDTLGGHDGGHLLNDECINYLSKDKYIIKKNKLYNKTQYTLLRENSVKAVFERRNSLFNKITRSKHSAHISPFNKDALTKEGKRVWELLGEMAKNGLSKWGYQNIEWEITEQTACDILCQILEMCAKDQFYIDNALKLFNTATMFNREVFPKKLSKLLESGWTPMKGNESNAEQGISGDRITRSTEACAASRF